MEIIRKTPIWFAIFGFILAVTGCSVVDSAAVYTSIPPSKKSLLTPTTGEIILIPPSTPTEQTAKPNSIPPERPRYSLAAIFDYHDQRLIVEEDIFIPHPTDKPLDSIDLVVPPNNWPGVLSIQDIKAGELFVEGYKIRGVTLNIKFGSPGWRPGEILTLHIQYSLDLPKLSAGAPFGASPFGYTPLQTNLVDWYPMVPPYQDGLGWIIHDPWTFGEYLVFPAADYQISLELGLPELIAAASSAPLNEGDPLLYSLESARNFVFSISPAYTVIEENVNGNHIYGYIFPGYEEPGQAVFDATREALLLYSDLFGPYEQSSVSIVQGDFNYGMEYEGLYFQGRGYFDTYNGSEQSYLVSIAVHEIAHQWWFGKVANDQALEPWLDEALCTFSELAYYEHLYPQSTDWWWGTRINNYAPSGRIDRSIYEFQEYGDQYLNYRNATYLQGAKFLVALKNEMGDVLFYTFLKDYGEMYRDQIAAGEDFFSLLGNYIEISSLEWIGEFFPDLVNRD